MINIKKKPCNPSSSKTIVPSPTLVHVVDPLHAGKNVARCRLAACPKNRCTSISTRTVNESAHQTNIEQPRKLNQKT